MVVRHKCDNPTCVEIKHLEIGTRKQNTHDLISRGASDWKEWVNASEPKETERDENGRWK